MSYFYLSSRILVDWLFSSDPPINQLDLVLAVSNEPWKFSRHCTTHQPIIPRTSKPVLHFKAYCQPPQFKQCSLTDQWLLITLSLHHCTHPPWLMWWLVMLIGEVFIIPYPSLPRSLIYLLWLYFTWLGTAKLPLFGCPLLCILICPQLREHVFRRS